MKYPDRSPRFARPWFALFAFVIATVWSLAATAQSPLTVTRDLDGVRLGTLTHVLQDHDGSLTIEDVTSSQRRAGFEASDQDALSLGFVRSAVWLKFTVVNPEPKPVAWLLEIAHASLDHVDLYVPKKSGGFELRATGDRVPFDARDIEYRNVVFQLEEPAHAERVYFLRVKTSGSMTIPLLAWSADKFLEHMNHEQPVLWMFYGLMLVMACYNAFIFFAVRERDYLYYCLYIGCYALFQFSLNGYAFQYLMPNETWLANQTLPMFIGLAFFWSCLFHRSYLGLKERMPLADKALKVGAIVSAALSVYALFGPYAVSIRVLVLVGALLTVVMLGNGIVLVWRGYRPAQLYTLAWGFFHIGIILYMMRTAGVLPANFVTTWSIQIGASLEVVLLSLALADRINAMRSNLSSLNKTLSHNVDELKNALDKAEEAARAKMNFLAMISHELRTPLNAIINIPGGLLKDFPKTDAVSCSGCESVFAVDEGDDIRPDQTCPECGLSGSLSRECIQAYVGQPERTAQHLGYIERSGKHLLEVVNGILDFSKLEAGKLKLRSMDTALAQLVDEVAQPLSELARSKGVTLKVSEISRDLSLYCDPVRISQVLINLVDNAVKFSEPNTKILVSAEADKESVVLRVADEGIGIAPEDRHRVFGTFEQIYQGNSRRFGGTGLGLSISKTLVEMHGGKIWIEDNEPRGSIFCLRLPKSRGTVTEHDAAVTTGRSLHPSVRAPVRPSKPPSIAPAVGES